MKYRCKPVVIEALQWKGTWTEDFNLFTKNNMNRKFFHQEYGALYIETLQGSMLANIDDWVIKDKTGNFKPCAKEIFEQLYEPIPGAPDAYGNDIPEDEKRYAIVEVGPNNEIPFTSYVQVKKNGGVSKEKLAEILPYVGKGLK